MLYSYKPIIHDFSKLHELINHTVIDVWCKPEGKFSLKKLHPNLQQMIKDLKNNSNDYLAKPIRLIYDRAKRLTPTQLKKIENGFKNNNAIEELCKGTVDPFLFNEIKTMDVALHNHLKNFSKNLYTKLTKLKSCKCHAGDLEDYYKKLVKQNSAELCPFCGLNDIKSERLSKRDPFDHYFPKDQYPLTSVNPLNLAPMCSDCNSSYKTQSNPILDKNGNKRRVFYPFSKSKHTVKIKFKLSSIDLANLKMSDLETNFSCRNKSEEVETWSILFGLDERYKDKCCKEKDAKTWYRKIIDEAQNYGLTVQQMYDAEIRTAKKRPLSDNNFLRVPFLEECNSLGLIK